MGALLDAKAFHTDRSAFHHLRCLALSNHIPTSRVHHVLDRVGLCDVTGRRAGTLSLGMSQRLGIAAALLGDPPIVLFDEPVIGLDAEGIYWIRTLLRQLASEGRTVFVSSHLMSEMALTADHLIVVGRGRLIADTDVHNFIHTSQLGRVVLRSPHLAELAIVLTGAGAVCTIDPHRPNTATVTGLSDSQVGDLATAHGLAIHGLATEDASLEAAFMALTQDSVEFRAERPVLSRTAR